MCDAKIMLSTKMMGIGRLFRKLSKILYVLLRFDLHAVGLIFCISLIDYVGKSLQTRALKNC